MIKSSEMLKAIANSLESTENEALLLAEDDDDCLAIVATACVAAAKILKNAAEQLEEIEPHSDVFLTKEHLEDLASFASDLDASGDPDLQKKASVLDQLLFTIAATPESIKARKESDNKRIEEMKKRYEESSKRFEEVNKLGDVKKEVEDHPSMKEYTIMEHALQTRSCPDHAGAQMRRLAEDTYQCSLDGRVYNYPAGYTLLNGDKVPGGSVQNQSQYYKKPNYNESYQTREEKLGM